MVRGSGITEWLWIRGRLRLRTSFPAALLDWGFETSPPPPLPPTPAPPYSSYSPADHWCRPVVRRDAVLSGGGKDPRQEGPCAAASRPPKAYPTGCRCIRGARASGLVPNRQQEAEAVVRGVAWETWCAGDPPGVCARKRATWCAGDPPGVCARKRDTWCAAVVFALFSHKCAFVCVVGVCESLVSVWARPLLSWGGGGGFRAGS